jgi:tetratricopeptide (TPR) repeat protein
LEKLERFSEAELVIRKYYSIDPGITERELYDFYKRAIDYSEKINDPMIGTWYHKLGLLLYEKAALPSRYEFLDSIIYFPVLNKELFVDMDLFYNLESDPQLKISDLNIRDASDVFTIPAIKNMPVTIEVPGIKEMFTLAAPILTPRMDAIKYLSKTIEFFTESMTVADINFKIGNVFVWSGSAKQAFPYYDKSIQLAPDNANMRMAMIDISTTLYKNQTALEHLNYLYDSSQINFEHHLVLAEFSIHEGQFAKGKKMLDEAKNIHPYYVPETDDLMGRMYLLSKKPAQAILPYKKYLAERENDPHTLYSIAKLYAQSGNKNEAWKWLQRSMANGFRYAYVLKADAVWDEMRKIQQWNELIKKYPARTYFEPHLIQLQSSSN